jgi:hypothetical protein
MALSYGDEDGLVAVLDNDRQDELLKRWRTCRKTMEATSPPPFRLDFGSLVVGTIARGRAAVTTDVSAVWSSTDQSGRLGGYRRSEQTWRFQTHNDSGWQVEHVEAPAWCTGYVVQQSCR